MITQTLKEKIVDFEEIMERCLNEYWYNLTPLEKERYLTHLISQEREELIGKIEKMKTMPAIKENELQGTSFTTYDMGFNKALNQVLQLIQDKKL